MWVVCADLEGVFIPEIWINVAEKTGIKELRLTTRDIKDYNELMKYRLSVLHKFGIKLKDIQSVISTMKPLDGALDFVRWLRSITRFVIVSDTFIEFAQPLLNRLENPLLFCHSLQTDETGNITSYILRQEDAKRKTIEAFKYLNYHTLAFGDSYNDISMLQAADKSILFCPPENVIADYPQFPVVNNVQQLKEHITRIIL